jgi:hypothetical protein
MTNKELRRLKEKAEAMLSTLDNYSINLRGRTLDEDEISLFNHIEDAVYALTMITYIACDKQRKNNKKPTIYSSIPEMTREREAAKKMKEEAEKK